MTEAALLPDDLSRRRNRVQVLDYLRFAAAASVLGYHYFFNGIHNGKLTSLRFEPAVIGVAKYGYLGVHMFFLISGYVVFNSTQNKTPTEFTLGRALRLFPAFWIALLLTSLVTIFWGHYSGLSITLPQVLVNMTMVPSLFGVAAVDGVYWTLVIELEFYALLFALLCTRQIDRIPTALPWVCIVMLVISFAAPSLSQMPFIGGYFSLFYAGALMAIIHKQGPRLWTTTGLLCSYVVAVRFTTSDAGSLSQTKGVYHSPVVVAAVVTVAFCAVLILHFPRIASLHLPLSRAAGAITYPLYLIHAHIGYILLSRFATDTNKWAVYPLVFLTILACAYALHSLVEKRLGFVWEGLFTALINWITRCGRVLRTWVSDRR